MEHRRRNSTSTGAGAAGPSPAGGSGADNAECWDSISYLESAFHHGFMRSRLATGDFVYHESPRLARELDEFCDVDAMHQPKGPIIVLGEGGAGKSAFLANWLVRRKKMFQNWQTSYPEFIFYHVVGCSRQSCFVSNLLERILREIKEYFELGKEIPDVEERLGWQLPRFLEAASKKGRVILIIDGLQRLRTSDGESILKWVPLAFPPNVRIVFSGTVAPPAPTKFVASGAAAVDGADAASISREPHEKASLNAQMIERIKLEANRRKWTSVHVPALSEDERRIILKKFLHKHKARSTGHLERRPGGAESSEFDGLKLFELQQKAIVAVPTTASPHFLRLLLGCLAWAADAGYNIHEVLESWLGAESVGQLTEAILRTMETGYAPTQQGVVDAHQFLAENGIGPETSAAPLRRKISADLGGASTKRQLAAELHVGSAHGTWGDTESAPPKEYGYHDARLPRPPVTQTEKLITSTVIDLKYADTTQRMPTSEKSSASKSSASSSSGGDAPMLTRMDSVHETKEVFVSSLRSDAARSLVAPIQEERGRRPSVTFASSPTLASSSSPPPTSPLRSPPPHPKLSHETPHAQSVRMPAAKTPLGKSALPTYIAGGQFVAPLRELLGRALCLLYVCRHGLLTNELRFILSAIVTEEREASKPLHRKASFSNVTNVAGLTGFAEDAWKALLRALRELGVLFVQDVVVLPLCKEVLREVVWWRYIGSERCEQRFHQWLIRFFRLHPTTFRRVEELPWHLKRCFQWDALRGVLVNLPMFQLLYTANYKHELFGYWKTLTDGPLLLYGAAEGEPPVFALPFDVVREYGKSLEDWYKSARPPTKTFTPVVQLVTKFMFEFSLAYQGSLPAFSCAPLDLKRLYADGFAFTEDLPHVQVLSSSSSAAAAASGAAAAVATTVSHGGIPMTASSAALATSTLVAALEAFATLGHGAVGAGNAGGASSGSLAAAKEREASGGNSFYFYQRWVWIHFPWLALGKEIAVRELFVSPNSVTGGGSSTSGGGGGGGSSSPSMSHGGSASSSGGSEATRVLAPADTGDAGDEEQRREGHGASLASLHPGGGDGAGAAAGGVKSIIHFDARFWDVKRSMFEPSAVDAQLRKRTKGAVSPPKIAALQRASVQSAAPATKTESVISPAHLFAKKATYVAVKNVLSSSVRRLPTAVASASLPLASTADAPAPSNNSSDTFLTEALLGDLGAAADASVSASSAAAGAAASGVHATRDLVLEHLNVSDLTPSPSAAFGLPAHFQDYPQTEWDLKRSYNYEVVLKLQTLYDGMKAEVTRKQAHVQLVKHKIQETAKRYELTMRDCEMAKHAIGEMSARMDRIELMLGRIAKQEKSHRKLIRGCETFLACEPAHFDTVKKELKLLQMQLQDLVEERKVLHVKKTRLQSIELPLLRGAIDKSKQLMSAVVDKLDKARAKVAQEQAATDKLFQRRLEMIESVHSASFQGSEASLEEAKRSASQLLASTTTRSLAAQVALQQCESMVEKIQKATGYTKLELILQKFVSREELNRSFEEQAKIYEARLKQIKLHQAELEQQLKSLEMSNAAVATDDPRVLEERLRVAELELARIERTQNSLLTTSKEVIAGASRIVKLIGITSCRSPYEGAIPAAQLWPPPVGLDSESSLLSEFESLEPKEIAALLQACQERASLMIDAIEVGRGDPDANFTVKQSDSPPKTTRGRAKGEDAHAKKTRTKKTPSNAGSTAEKRDRSFDRGSISSRAFAGAALGGLEQLLSAQRLTDAEDEVDDDPATRESVKASSRSKIGSKKRVVGPGVVHGGGSSHQIGSGGG